MKHIYPKLNQTLQCCRGWGWWLCV